MVEKQTKVEMRKHKRFKTLKNTFVALENGHTEVGQMINISKDGLAFSYLGKEELIRGWHKVDIFLSGKHFYLKEVPFKAISEYYIYPKTPFSKVLMKVCRGQFGELTHKQKSRLDYFIANHTIGSQ